MTKFSEIVYKKGGNHHAPKGTYDHKGVKSQEELDEALKGGWFKTMPEAMGEVKKEEKPKDTGPTRDEAKQKANELGLEYASNIPTKKLITLIEEKIKENELD